MADLVHVTSFRYALDEGLGLGAVGVDVAARLEHVEPVSRMLGRGIRRIADRGRRSAAMRRRAIGWRGQSAPCSSDLEARG